MALQYRCAPLPAEWPGVPTPQRKPSPFKANWGSTIALLAAELRHLGARDVVLRLAVRDDQIRGDGGVFAKARIQNAAVILECKVGPDRLSFPCDRFNWWEDNVRAIALALEALRKVDRYGVRAGKQYEGFKALPSGDWGSVELQPLTPARAAARMLTLAECDEDDQEELVEIIVRDSLEARFWLRCAQVKVHPDHQGGSTVLFQELQQIKQVLAAHHGVTF